MKLPFYDTYHQMDCMQPRFYIGIRFCNFHRNMIFHTENHIAVLSNPEDIYIYLILENIWRHCCIDICWSSFRHMYLLGRLYHTTLRDSLKTAKNLFLRRYYTNLLVRRYHKLSCYN